jgi:hypothetical protein
MQTPLKRIYVFFESRMAPPSTLQPSPVTVDVATSAESVDPKNPFSFVSDSALQTLEDGLKGYHRNELLQIRLVRQVLARERVNYFMSHGHLRRLAQVTEDVAFNTVDYNIDGAVSAADLDRPIAMFNIVTAIERVNRNIQDIDVLSIGPRSEIEIFGMMAAGFHPDRIRAVDLFSYSPYVDLGDMHDLPYEDNSFDIVFLGWVLSYSKHQPNVVKEVMRVCRDRAIVVLAGDYSDDKRVGSTFKKEATHMQSCDQLLALFGDQVGHVYFRHDPDPPKVAMVMTVFEVKKP